MGAKHNKCCCGDAAYLLYMSKMTLVLGSAINGELIPLNPATGAAGSVLYTDAKDITSIACDPTSAQIYIACGSSNTVKGLNASGTVLWSANYGSRVQGVAVSNAGEVYAVGQGGTIKKYDAATGTEITTGWPYTHGAALYSVCVDQSGNVYACGAENATPKNCVALASDGTLLWNVRLRGPAGSGYCGGIAIDAPGTTLAASRQSPGATDQTMFLITASSGAFTGTAHGNQMFAAAMSPTGHYYHGGFANSLGVGLRKDLLAHFNVGVVSGIAIGPDDNEIIAMGSGGVRSVSLGWLYTDLITNTYSAVEASTGRVGAFGL